MTADELSIRSLEAKLTRLYEAGHRTGFGPGTTGHAWDAGCTEARRTSDLLDILWSAFDRDRRRVAEPTESELRAMDGNR